MTDNYSQKPSEEQVNEKELSFEHQLVKEDRILEKVNRELFCAKEKIIKLENQFKIIFEFLAFPCFILNRDGIIKLVNSKGVDLLRSKKEPLLNKSFFDFVAHDCKLKFDLHLKSVLTSMVKNSCKIKIHRHDDSEILVNIDSLSLYSCFGEGENCLLVINSQNKINDNYNSHVTSDELNSESNNNSNVNFVRDKFFSIIAHDLKTPLSGLIGFSEILDKEYYELTDDEKREFIGHLNKAAKNLNTLLENLLNWSRIQTEGVHLKFQSINVKSVVQEIINLFTQNIINKHIIIHKKIEDSLRVFADQNSFQTILRNLISNAIKFSYDNGTIVISASENDYEDGFVKIVVEDNGAGISKENIQKLFKIDLNYTTVGTSQERGTGLGLIICKELVEKNGGKIWAESQVGKGTKMIFTLPKAKNKNTSEIN